MVLAKAAKAAEGAALVVDNLQEFTEELGFIVAFLLGLLFVSFVGDAALQAYLWLVLFSMVLLNSDKIVSLLKGGEK